MHIDDMPAAVAHPGWYADPADPSGLRYWSGAHWTEHTSARPAAARPSHRVGTRRSRLFGRIGLVLCVLAVAVVATPAVGFGRVAARDGVRLTEGTQHLHVRAHETYGLYVDDLDNSGYPERCDVLDMSGRPVLLRDAPMSITSSETESLDVVFDSGSGRITVRCPVTDDVLMLRQVPDLAGLVRSVGIGLLLALLGGIFLTARLVSRARPPVAGP